VQPDLRAPRHIDDGEVAPPDRSPPTDSTPG
jgi:hypothetical protein